MMTMQGCLFSLSRRLHALSLAVFILFFVILSATGVSRAADSLVFGPHTFERGNGKPEAVFLSFPADGLENDYALFLYNGDREQPKQADARVSSAEIFLNGELVVCPQDLNQQIGFLAVPVVLQPENELSVELRGAPGSSLALEIGRADNAPPVADAGPDQTLAVGETVWLDGSASYDLNGDRLGCAWRLVELPESSLAELLGTDRPAPRFGLDAPGDYLVELLVNDGERDSEPDRVRISTENSAPVANAGPDRTLAVGETAVLDGGASIDVDGDSLSYAWTLPEIPEQSHPVS